MSSHRERIVDVNVDVNVNYSNQQWIPNTDSMYRRHDETQSDDVTSSKFADRLNNVNNKFPI